MAARIEREAGADPPHSSSGPGGWPSAVAPSATEVEPEWRFSTRQAEATGANVRYRSEMPARPTRPGGAGEPVSGAGQLERVSCMWIRRMTHFTRRHFLTQQAFGLGGLAARLALAAGWALAVPGQTGARTGDVRSYSRSSPPHAPQARAMISMFMQGGPSHVDLFDPKPELTKRHLQTYTGDIKYDNAAEASAKLFGSPWKFSKHGECGMELSELLPHLGQVADDICLIRSMHTGVNNHGQSINALNTGRITPGRPALGSWMTYALGTESQNLPAFVVLSDPGGLPVLGVENWQNGWLPSLYQGTVVRPQEPRILNLDPPRAAPRRRPRNGFSNTCSRSTAIISSSIPREHDLAARIQSYELAARMQVAAKEALDISRESETVHKLYGIDDPVTRDYGSRCLIARRLVERGVRFVQIFTGNQTWDHHGEYRESVAGRLQKDRQARGGPGAGPQADGPARHDARALGGRDGPPAGDPERKEHRPRPQHLRIQHVAGRRRRQGGLHLRRDRRTGAQGGQRRRQSLRLSRHAAAPVRPRSRSRFRFTRPTGPGSLIDGQAARIVVEILKHKPT